MDEQRNIMALFEAGKEKIVNSDYPGALANFSEVRRLNPAFPNIYRQIGVTFLMLEQPFLAISNLLEAHDRNPEESSVCHHLGFAYYIVNNNDAAIMWYNKAIELDEQSATPHYSLAMVYVRMKSWSRAEHELRVALKLNNAHTLAHATYAQILMRQDRLQEAYDHFQKSEVLDLEDAKIVQYFAYVCCKLGKYDEAQELKAKFQIKNLAQASGTPV